MYVKLWGRVKDRFSVIYMIAIAKSDLFLIAVRYLHNASGSFILDIVAHLHRSGLMVLARIFMTCIYTYLI